ncbi:MAG: hypothetical protein ACT4PE_00990 [Candidatus Eiseniibacteriota bacterium]
MTSARLSRGLLTGATLLLLAGEADADAPHPTLRGVRPLGMGGAFLAVADDRNALHDNPAGLARLMRTTISGLGVHGAIDDEFLSVVDFIQEHEEQFSDFSTVDAAFLDELEPYDDRWVSADAGAYADLTRPGFGIGVFSTGRAQIKVDRGVYEPRVHADVLDDIVAVVGGAMDLGRGDLAVGGTLKTIWRRQFSRVLTAREVADFRADDLVERLEGADAGFAMDLGALWSPLDSPFSAAAVLRDAAGRVAGESLGPAFDVGAAWHVRPRLVLAADLRDTFESETAFGTKVHVGAELRFPVVTLRAGANQGYSTIGASLALPVLSMDYAFYGRELGHLPGADGQYLHAVEARLGF